jgi:predicted RNA binding protein YcfA (HicA-like mRNA interferase family)
LILLFIVCIIHTMNSKQLVKEMKQAGWKEIRVRGSHHQFSHPDYKYVVTVPHPKKDLGKGLVKLIRKQAHLES